MASKGVELGGYNNCFDVNDKTINTLVDFTEEELKAFTLESMKMQSSLDEVKMLDQLHYQTFLTTTSSTNMSQAPVSSTTTMSSMPNIQQVSNSTPVLRQILNEQSSKPQLFVYGFCGQFSYCFFISCRRNSKDVD